MRRGSAWRRTRTALTAGPGRQALALEAAASLTAARLALATLSFGTVARRLGPLMPPGSAGPAAAGEAAETARQIGWAVRAASLWLPFPVLCLPQAMAARAMLRRRGIGSVLHFGTTRAGKGLAAGHAWLDAAGVPVVGYPVDPSLTELGCIVSAAPRAS